MERSSEIYTREPPVSGFVLPNLYNRSRKTEREMHEIRDSSWFLALQMICQETAHAARYDLKAERTIIAPGEIKPVPTGVKAYMPRGALSYDRSSNLVKRPGLINSSGLMATIMAILETKGIFAQMKTSQIRKSSLKLETYRAGCLAPF